MDAITFDYNYCDRASDDDVVDTKYIFIILLRFGYQKLIKFIV